ncbi:Mg-protoporphyrin IX methyl transferase [Stieleria maiorica]|uniref:Mg-protoporphyrin IX methyl transferase n=1 Tax=Stieleria maiorica TaxID=2795974 RepID=A0A5B9M6A8_9BACT|nr:class I SAM-dependent methyltransferase [Stieleria maiorica]QEF96359.1 Mg-protoporphyrin IX methyl transferase [Stieleria maiorica]
MNSSPEQAQASQASAVRAAGDRTIQQYENWMQTNAAAHLMRAARESGITARLREKQHTLDELCQSLSLCTETTKLLLDGLVAIGFVEQYEEDFALARAGHLLCQYDDDLGDSRWERLVGRLNNRGLAEVDAAAHRARIAATQWIHTAAAMQAAEILDIGGESATPAPRILDLGCGSAVWSCAFAHRDAGATVVAVDEAAALKAACSTADSIGLSDRFRTIESDPLAATVGEQQFDLVVLAQSLSGYSDDQAARLLQKSAAALKSGGRIAAPDFYLGPSRAGLKESLGRLSVHLATPAGRVRDLRECQAMFLAAGLGEIQFTYLAASEAGLGMMVAARP